MEEGRPEVPQGDFGSQDAPSGTGPWSLEAMSSVRRIQNKLWDVEHAPGTELSSRQAAESVGENFFKAGLRNAKGSE